MQIMSFQIPPFQSAILTSSNLRREILTYLEELPKQSIKIANTYKALTFILSNTNSYLQFVSSKTRKRIQLRFILACIYFLIISIQAYSFWNTLDFSSKIFLIYVYVSCLLGLVLVYANLKHERLIFKLLQAFNFYSKTLVRIIPQSRCKLELKRLKILHRFQCLAASVVLLPIAFHVAIFFTPCTPFVAGFWMLPECSNDHSLFILPIRLKVCFVGFGAFNWCLINVHYLFQFYFTGFSGVSFRLFLSSYWR